MGWKQDERLSGGGVLVDLGAHILDLIYHFMGEVKELTCKKQIIYEKRPDKNGNMAEITAEDAAYMLLTMKNGAAGTVEVSKIATGTNDELRFEIHGDKGAISFNLMEPDWLYFYDNSVPDKPFGGKKGYTKIECVGRYAAPGNIFPGPKFTIGWLRGHVHCLYNFLSCIYEGRPAAPSFEEAVYVQRIIEKADSSSGTGIEL
jgi:predicted dehydrogenase